MGICLNCNKETKYLKKEKKEAKFCCHSCYLDFKKKNKKLINVLKPNTCKICNKELKSTKKEAKICSSCKIRRLQPQEKVCCQCSKQFIDTSRSKNAKYCSQECGVKAGCKRYSTKVKSGYYGKPKPRDRKEYRKRLYRERINFRLASILRSRLGGALSGEGKVGSAVADMGCTLSELRTYLESLFKPGMSWENYGRDGWHIDHIRPLASFDLEDPEQFRQACHYTNLQPLWAEENFSKGCRY
jgi:hypothetical protein